MDSGKRLRRTVADMLRKRRRWTGLRQVDIARGMGCTQAAVAAFEAGREDALVSTVVRFLLAAGYMDLALTMRRGRRSWRVRLG